MSFADFQERLSRSIKVVGLPDGYSQEDILENLRNAGAIEETKLGPNEMIVIFASSNEKDLSKMYDGCPIGDYVLKLEDPTSFNFGGDDTSAPPQNEEKQPEPQVPAPSTHYEPQTEYKAPVQHHEEPVHKPEPVVEQPKPVVEHHEPVVHKPEPVIEQPKPVVHHEEPVVHKPEPVIEQPKPVVHHEEPVVHKPEPVVEQPKPVVHHEEPVVHKPEPVVEQPKPVVRHEEPVVHHQPAPVVEKKVEPQPERKAEVVHTEKKVETTPTPVPVVEKKTEVRGGESSKDLLRELQTINLPARAGLPNDDLFNVVTKRSYLLIFTMVWGLQLFLRSVF